MPKPKTFAVSKDRSEKCTRFNLKIKRECLYCGEDMDKGTHCLKYQKEGTPLNEFIHLGCFFESIDYKDWETLQND